MTDKPEVSVPQKVKKVSYNMTPFGCLPFVLGILIVLLACANWDSLSRATQRWLDGQCNCQCK